MSPQNKNIPRQKQRTSRRPALNSPKRSEVLKQLDARKHVTQSIMEMETIDMTEIGERRLLY